MELIKCHQQLNSENVEMKKTLEMAFELVSSEHGNLDFNVINSAPIHRVVIPQDIKCGDIFNLYHGESSKAGISWVGKFGCKDYDVKDIERSIRASDFFKETYEPNPYIIDSSLKAITTLILGANKNPHKITKADRFLDNGLCIQLLKENSMKVQYAGDSLALDDHSISVIKKYQRINHASHEFSHPSTGCEVFSLVADDERFLLMGYESQEDVDNKIGFPLGGHDYYANALNEMQEKESEYFMIKMFDSDMTHLC